MAQYTMNPLPDLEHQLLCVMLPDTPAEEQHHMTAARCKNACRQKNAFSLHSFRTSCSLCFLIKGIWYLFLSACWQDPGSRKRTIENRTVQSELVIKYIRVPC